MPDSQLYRTGSQCSIIILQYNILCLVKLFALYESIGGPFGEITTGTAETTITDKI